jgi:hypothetical protein
VRGVTVCRRCRGFMGFVVAGVCVVFAGEGFWAAGFASCGAAFAGSVFAGVEALSQEGHGGRLLLLLVLDIGRICRFLRFRVDCFP